MRFSKAYLGTALLVGAAVVAGCASERDVRNTVQPNIVRKADLTGQWYFHPTVVDVPYGTSVTYMGDDGATEKIVWDIQEDVLYARRAIEQVNNTDKSPGATNFVGQPVGAWRIQSQFDIIRDYNAATGEESNVIRESTERPWYQREFLRVDWATNLADNWDFMVDHVQTTPVSYYVTDPNSPDALRFERRQVPGQADKTKTEVGYIDFSEKLIASPETVYYDGYGYIPACWLDGSAADCTSQEITIRNSFMKLDPTREYEPLAWTDLDQQRFGFFETERLTYNRQYGVTNSAKQKFAQHHNLWMDPWQKNADGSYVLDDAGNKVRKAEKDRTARQMAYWANDVFPDDLKDTGAQVVKSWSDILGEVVKHYADQGPTAGGQMQIQLLDGSKAAFDPAVTPVILWCADNPTKATSPAGCIAQAGGVGVTVRLGDIRYNMMPSIDKPQQAGPLGLGPSICNPETGETLSAVANIYGAALDSYAAWARDVVLLLNGNLDVSKYVTGTYVKSYVGANLTGIRTAAQAARSAEETKSARNNMNFSWLPHGDNSNKVPPQTPAGWKAAMIAGSKQIANSNLLGPGFDEGELRLASIQGSYLEDELLSDPEYRQMAVAVLAANGLDPTTPATGIPADVRRQISPVAMFGSVAHQMTQDRRLLQALHGADMADFGEDSALGLAKDYKTKFDLNNPDDQAKVWADLRAKIYLGVTQHEMGHNMGLRHNFEGTIDAMNYHKEYWDLRTQAAGGKDKILGRVDQPITQAELDGNEQEYQYSTVMDYGAKFNSDTSGLGKYDRAALLYTYGNLLEVFNDQRNDGTILQIADFQTFGWPTALVGQQIGGVTHQVAVNYNQFANLVNLEDRDVVERSTLTVDPQTNATGNQESSGKRRVTVPYRFCSDEFAGASVTCARYDQGPDVYEIAQDYIKRYNAYYIFNNFARDRWGWEGLGYPDRIVGRYFEPIMEQEHTYVVYQSDLSTFLSQSDLDFLYSDSRGWKGWTMAVQDGFNMFGHVMTQPDAGSMNTTTTPLGVTMLTQTSDDPGSGVLNMPLIDGRYFSTTWDFNEGYYWFERQTRVGVAIDKILATQIMGDASANYYGADTFSDIRRFSINYYTIYGEQLRNTFGGLLNEDVMAMAPVYDGGTLKQVNWSDLNNTGFTTPRNLGTGKLIDPMMTFTVKYVASLYGAAMFPQTFDNSYVDQSKIFVDGNGEQVTFSPTQSRSWTDPLSGKTYRAFEPAGQNGTPTTIGGRLLAHLQALYNPANADAMTNYKLYIEQIDLQRSISTYFDHTRF